MDDKQIEKELQGRTPANTRKTREFCWRKFVQFLKEAVSDPTPMDFDENKWTDKEINQAMKRFAFNMRKANGDNYKDESIKSIWNSVAKQIMSRVFNATGRSIDIFKDQAFQEARDSKFVKRRAIQKDVLKRKISATPLTSDESVAMMKVWGIDTPNGMNRTLFHLGGFALANRGGDQSSWHLQDFQKEFDNKGQPTGIY
jgi:hypothetical protein